MSVLVPGFDTSQQHQARGTRAGKMLDQQNQHMSDRTKSLCRE